MPLSAKKKLAEITVIQKTDLIQKISKKIPHLPADVIAFHVNKIIEAMNQTLMDKKRIEVRGFGSFSITYRQPSKAYNPKIKKYITSEGRFRPFFKAGKELKERVNGKK